MGIGDIISGISDFINIFRSSNDSGDNYLSSNWASSTATSKKRKPKHKKNTSATSSKKQYTPPVKKEQPFQPLWQKPENYDQKACQLIVNCLKQVKLDRAESAVEKLQKQYSYKTNRELARILIVKKSFALANVALDSRDPGAFADKSAKEIIEGMETVQIPRIVRFSVEMIYQIALIYGLPFRYLNWEVEVISVFYAALLGDIATQYGIDWLKFGTRPEKSISSEIKALMIYAIGETACLFYEKIHSHNFNPFKKANAFSKISRQAQNYLKLFNSETKIKKMVSKEIEKAFPIEYHKLCDLLEAKSWKEADRETFDIFLKLMSRKKLKLCEAVLLANAKFSPTVWISKLDYEDLEILNNIWIKNSDGHFGFAIQSQIYMQTQSLECFYQGVGWKINSELKSYDQLTFDIDSPKGHLPGFWLYPDFPLVQDETIADWLTVFLKYVSTLPVKVIAIGDMETTIVNSSEQSPDVNSDDQQED
ncbi:GUN4 domain-containing protein [Nostoc sp. NMS4]|uniref:GUN4 domain-containing protein n=1 Tax=Nostoc sp. NMS4 TaxID=2815390 RepID=UPI0025F0199F|nr:GUN4 domain-containing protein [Nostoc sp. NMS4]MBN3921924.1 GUN4 domain-containing protein [Nostoc sp. NMS4]